jgi:dTDP-glucose 4,6-dehydratase
MRVLVTGSGGFVGSQLMTTLPREYGHQTFGIDQRVNGDDEIRADITAFEDLYRAFNEVKPELVIHTAGEVGRMVGELYPQKMINVNDVGLTNLIALCIERKVRLVNFSTSEVYGRLFDLNERVTEDSLFTDSIFQTTNIYALSKLAGEAIISHYVQKYGLNAVSVRPFMLYGPGERPTKFRSAMGNFVKKALRNEPLTVHKGSVRSWCYIGDFIRGLMLVAAHPFEGRYEAFNIGSDEYVTAKETAEKVIRIANSSSKMIEVETPTVFSTVIKRASIQKLRSLGYEPQVSLDEGIKKVVEWQRAL